MGTQIRRLIPSWSGLSLVVALLVAALAPVAWQPSTARAATATFANPAPVVLPDADGVGAPSPSVPYPSEIVVSGVAGSVTKVTVTLTGITESGFFFDVDLLLVGPTGATTLLLSDVGCGMLANVTYTLDDAAASPVGCTSGTYRPTNTFTGVDDPFPSTGPTPPPSGPYGATLSAFNGTSPNGTWRLYGVDQFLVGSGTIAGGWSLTITTVVAPVASDDGATTGRDTAVVIPVLANDSDPDGTIDPTTVAVASGPANGNTSVNATTGAVTYTPSLGFTGPDSFTYTVKDNDGAVSNASTVSVTVTNQIDLGIAKTDGATSAPVGSTVTYTLVASNAGPSTAIGAPVTDAFPPELVGVSWTCTPANGGSCAVPGGNGSIGTTVTLPPGAVAAFSVTGSVAATGSASLANTASVGVPAGLSDTNPSNNTATDTNAIPATSTPTSTATPTPTGTATTTSTPTSTLPQAILPAQSTATPGPVRVSVQRAGADRLLVTIAAVGPIDRVAWPSVPNVAVETSAGAPITGGSLTPPPGSTTAVFYVRKTGGTSATLPLTVTGTFPTWQTFVGGGPSAW